MENIIPKNIVECIAVLEATVPSEIVEKFIGTDETSVYEFHHTIGRQLRNNWGLWQNSPLSQWFFSIGVYHADDMSGIIFTTFHRYINKRQIDLAGQVVYYENYWKNSLGEEGYEKMKSDILAAYSKK